MKRITILLALTVASSAIAGDKVTPVVNTEKKGYSARISYCNDGSGFGSLKNVVCYNHDACYSDPTFKGTKKPPATKAWCDNRYLKECKMVDGDAGCYVDYTALQAFGWISWNRARENDK